MRSTMVKLIQTEPTPIDMKTEFELIEHLDFDHEPPCDWGKNWHPDEERPASKKVVYSHECGLKNAILLCSPCTTRFMREIDWECTRCGGYLEYLSEVIDSITDL